MKQSFYYDLVTIEVQTSVSPSDSEEDASAKLPPAENDALSKSGLELVVGDGRLERRERGTL